MHKSALTSYCENFPADGEKCQEIVGLSSANKIKKKPRDSLVASFLSSSKKASKGLYEKERSCCDRDIEKIGGTNQVKIVGFRGTEWAHIMTIRKNRRRQIDVCMHMLWERNKCV